MKIINLLLNLPWSFFGIVSAILSVPKNVRLTSHPFAMVFTVRSFWWLTWIPIYRGTRALAYGNVVQLGPDADMPDLQHELIHVEQFEREPFIFPILHSIEWFRRGYRNNKYEDEAFARSGSRHGRHRTAQN